MVRASFSRLVVIKAPKFRWQKPMQRISLIANGSKRLRHHACWVLTTLKRLNGISLSCCWPPSTSSSFLLTSASSHKVFSQITSRHWTLRSMLSSSLTSSSVSEQHISMSALELRWETSKWSVVIILKGNSRWISWQPYRLIPLVRAFSAVIMLRLRSLARWNSSECYVWVRSSRIWDRLKNLKLSWN